MYSYAARFGETIMNLGDIDDDGYPGTVCQGQGQGQGFFICHIIVIQGITRSEMQSNQVRSVTVQNNKSTNYISNITQGHTYCKKGEIRIKCAMK